MSSAFLSASVDATDDREGLLLDSSASVDGGLSFANEISLYSSLQLQASRDGDTLIRTRGANASASAKPFAHIGLSASFALGTSPDYVNSTGGRYRSTGYGAFLTGVERIEASVFWSQQRFDSDRDGAGYAFSSWSARVNLHPRPRHHVTLFLNRFDSEDRLDPELPATEPDVRFQWQLTYTFEASRFSRLIVGASRSEIGGAGIDHLSPQRELAFAKWVLEL